VSRLSTPSSPSAAFRKESLGWFLRVATREIDQT